jgi:hypothetical protein
MVAPYVLISFCTPTEGLRSSFRLPRRVTDNREQSDVATSFDRQRNAGDQICHIGRQKQRGGPSTQSSAGVRAALSMMEGWRARVITIDKLREVWSHLSSDEKKLFDVVARAYPRSGYSQKA